MPRGIPKNKNVSLEVDEEMEDLSSFAPPLDNAEGATSVISTNSDDEDDEDESEEDDEEEQSVEEKVSEVEQLRRELAQLRKDITGDDSMMVKKEKIQGHAKVRFFQEEDGSEYPIIFWKDSREIGDRLIANFVILKDGKEETVKYDQIKLLNEMRQYNVKILKERWTHTPKHQGPHPTYITQVQEDPYHDKMSGKRFSPSKIKLEEMSSTCIQTVLFLDGPMEGKKIKLSSVGNALNS